MQQALYRKYRPGKFADLVGQEPIKLTLANQVKAGAVGHAYIFAGPKGTGKTTAARILAKAVNCLEIQAGDPCGKCALCQAADEGTMLDLIEIDAASNTGVDNIRDLISKIYISPTMGKYKVYVIDEAHMLSKGAFNALLKTLEEPPTHAIFILASTEIDKFPSTIVSRCQRFDFRPIKLAEMAEYLMGIAKAEQIEIVPDAIDLIAEQSGGGMRDALSFLERAMAMGTKIDAASLAAWFGIVGWTELLKLTELVVAGRKSEALEMIDGAYRNGYDLTRLATGWTNMIRSVVAAKLGNVEDLGLAEESAKKLTDLAERLSYEQIVWWLEQTLMLASKVKASAIPQLPLELMVLKVIEKIAGQQIDESGGQNDRSGSSKSKIEIPKEIEEIQASEEIKEHQVMLSANETEINAPEVVASAQLVELDWEAFTVGVKKQSPTMGAVLSNAQWVVEEGMLVIMIASKFHKEKLEQPASREMVAGALAGLGVELRVEYRLDESGQVSRAAVDPSLVSELFG